MSAEVRSAASRSSGRRIRCNLYRHSASNYTDAISDVIFPTAEGREGGLGQRAPGACDGAGSAVQGITLIVRPSPGGVVSSSFMTDLTAQIGPVPSTTIGVLVLFVVDEVFLLRSKWGTHVYAVGSRQAAAYSAGVLITRVCVLAYAEQPRPAPCLILLPVCLDRPPGRGAVGLSSFKATGLGRLRRRLVRQPRPVSQSEPLRRVDPYMRDRDTHWSCRNA
jgi:hypothetical protein